MYIDADDLIHGIRYTYTHKGCRCPDCRAANAKYKREKVRYNRDLTASSSLAFLHAYLSDALPSITHGITNSYDWWGCRCKDCTEAHGKKDREYRERRRQKLLELI